MADIFVFGSNTQGRHGKGAALEAKRKWGAWDGIAQGPTGRAYAIFTKELRRGEPPIRLAQIHSQVVDFIRYAKSHQEDTFWVTAIGCGLAGFKPSEIGPMFKGAPKNVKLPPEFKTP